MKFLVIENTTILCNSDGFNVELKSSFRLDWAFVSLIINYQTNAVGCKIITGQTLKLQPELHSSINSYIKPYVFQIGLVLISKLKNTGISITV